MHGHAGGIASTAPGGATGAAEGALAVHPNSKLVDSAQPAATAAAVVPTNPAADGHVWPAHSNVAVTDSSNMTTSPSLAESSNT